MIFYIIPFFRVLYYSLIDDQFSRNFIGFQNYIDTMSNEYFRLALGNSLLLIVICIPILIFLAVIISILIYFSLKKLNILRSAFVLPMFIPSACIALVWQLIPYDKDILFPIPIYAMFIWKSLGICIVILTAAISAISNDVYDAAALDGAGFFTMHFKITAPIISPAVFFCILLSITNSFRIYRETYLLLGTNYPPKSFYTLQFYMNNHFIKLNYQSLAAGSVLTTLLLLVIIIGGILLQRRHRI